MKKIISAILAFSTMLSGVSVFASDCGAVEFKAKAFPTAEGGGMYTKGARRALDSDKNIEVYHVTNLNDSGEGSFRDAVSKDNRIIVFDVSGMIDLSSRVSISGDNLTILGQTAPGDGICFRGNSVKVNGNNIILRYLRFRVGSKLADGSDTSTQDGFEIADFCENIIMDHCSISWGTDENLSAYAIENVTVQNCIVAEALNQSIHSKGEHSYGGIWGGVNVSFHHNIIASHKSRNPKIGTSETVNMTEGYTDDQSVIDMWNNVIYNWGDKSGYGAENGANVNIVNNYYKPGPATPTGKRARIFELSPGNKYQAKWSGSIYADGNVIDDDSEIAKDVENALAVNEENWQIEKKTGVYLDSDGIEVYEKLDTLGENSYIHNIEEMQSAEDAYEYVIANAGARLPKLDAVDSRIIENVVNRTAPETGSNGSSYLLDDPIDGVPEGEEDLYDDRGYPLWVSEIREADYDSDNDGIADEWEDRMGLNKENPTDSLLIGPDGYTYLEIFAEDGITHNAGDVTLTVDGNQATISSTTGGTFDIYVNDEKVETITLASDIPEGSTLISASYEDGTLTEVKSSEYTGGELAYPEVNGSNVKHFIWNSLSGMKPVTLNGGSETFSISTDNMGVSTVTAVKSDKSVYSNMDYYFAPRPTCEVPGIFDSDMTFVMELNQIPTVTKDAYGLLTVSDKNGVSYSFGAGSNENYEKVLSNNGEKLPLEDTKLITIAIENGTLKFYRGNSPLNLTLVEEYPFEMEIGNHDSGTFHFDESFPAGEENTTSINIKYITQKTEPQVEIANVEENQRLGFYEDIEVNVTPDSTTVQQISISLNGTVIAQKEVNVTEAETVSIPVSFTSIASGTLEVSCIDSNLCTATDSVNITVSADLTPWQIADVGVDESEPKTYVSVTNDYTYKINGPQGLIGGASDEFGYVYQKFTGDNRIYYRSRMQGGEQFGIMLRKSLDADSESYFFGGEYESGSLVYNMKARDSKGAEMTSTATENLGGANLYFIAEKAGDKLNIYKTENSATIYTTKTLLHSIDVSALGDEYYMGFAVVYDRATGNPPDAGWVAMDNSGDINYAWNFDYGLDWCWQMQEANVLRPQWSTETVGGNETGKMVLKTDSDYTSERYVFHEYIMDDAYVPEMSADVLLYGDAPAMNVYMQTGNAETAYKVTFDTDGKVKDADGNEICEYNVGTLYNVKMAVDNDAVAMDTLCKLTISSAQGTVIEEIAIPTDSHFRTQINTEKKTPVTNAVYFEPVKNVTGTYYIDNISVNANEPSVKIEKTESWYTFEDITAITGAFDVAGTTSLGGSELSGEVMSVAAGAELKEKDNDIAGVYFPNHIRIKGTSETITVPVKNGSLVTVYSSSTNSSSTRPLFINGTQYSILNPCASTYKYTGEDGTITVYGGDNIEIYGISVTTKQVLSE